MTHSIRLTFLGALALVFSMLQALQPVWADTISVQDEKAVQIVVQNQLTAFAKDDAEKAFSYATPELRKSIGNASTFMSMVKGNYPVVYRPTSVFFLKPERSGDDMIQRVQMLDASGSSWLAQYNLQRQKDKTWRISGCVLVENKGRTA